MSVPELEHRMEAIPTPHTEIVLHRCGINVIDVGQEIKGLQFFSDNGFVYTVMLGPDGRNAIVKMLTDSPIVVPKLNGMRPIG